ncbi:endoribonuclease Dicer-like [Thrips palmi]|uniref:Endoribonuclease Dicer-like n=1 Tax=Thrips palmi TaxID=161013 RepID=A0A6P9A7K4_THRPL|nr:endoribonuclease Dicer-like [Thrips palmi]XP_034253908.1 endoribonuclease Dicer-like [Thrips palmi]
MEELRQISMPDYNLLDFRLSSIQPEKNHIIYHPSSSILNFCLLDLVKRFTSTAPSTGHILIVSPSKSGSTQLRQFLSRHLLTDSIGSRRRGDSDGSWPTVIITETSSLPAIFPNGYKIKLDLIIVLECHNAIFMMPIIELIAEVKAMKKGRQPQLICFTSCIVSDTCNLNEIQDHVRFLEDFYGGELLSTCDQSAMERNFSTPIQTIDCFEKQENLSDTCLEALHILNSTKEFCSNYFLEFDGKMSKGLLGECQKRLDDILCEIQQQMEELGEYGGSIAVLNAFKDLVRLYTFVSNREGHNIKLLLSHLVCTLAKFRKILEDDMFRVQVSERGERFSSKKVQLVLNYLKDLPKSHRALIIVRNLNTASNLTLILQKIATLGKKHSHRTPELMINCASIPASDKCIDILSWERNMEVYSRFVEGTTNTVVLCGELLGLDLPSCDFVLNFDDVDKFSHFLLSKNLTKSQIGKHALLTAKTNLSSFESKIESFKETEKELEKILTGYESLPSSISDGFRTELGTEIKPDELVKIIERYCKSLPRDKFTPCFPVWKMKKYSFGATLYRASLYLPRISPVNYIKSVKAPTWLMAQQNAALSACQELYRVGELDDNMLMSWQATMYSASNTEEFQASTIKINSKINFELEHEFSTLGLVSKFDDGTPCEEDEDIVCNLIYPLSLTSVRPKPDTELFLHKLKIWPVTEAPPMGDIRKTALYELLCDKCSYAILSSKPLLKVCQFPIFLFGHELSVEVEVNESKLMLDRAELGRLGMFHCKLFMNVLPIVQNFMQFDVFNGPNSYLIVPLTSDGLIDWVVVGSDISNPEPREFTHEEKAQLVCTPETHERTMVKPYYRHLIKDQVYLVASVCMDMNADSCFPTEDFDSFTDYYSEKYKIFLERPELPLLEVYLINTKVNGLLPRVRSHKLRREEKMEDFREHMVPELCMPLPFPAALWLKLSTLPSVLHRLSRLLVVEEFRRIIAKEIGFGASDNNAHSLRLNVLSGNDALHHSKVPPSTVKRGLAIGNVKLEDRKRKAHSNKPWKVNQEPVDIHRDIESLNFLEIRIYDEFLLRSNSVPLSTSQVTTMDTNEMLVPTSEEIPYFDSENKDEPHDGDFTDTACLSKQDEVPPKYLNLLKPYEGNCGPQQSELLEVFTSSISNDGINMDHIQVLGNAFLTLTISAYAYKHCLNNSSSSSISLHQLRTAFMSKSNLVQCSVRNQLCNRIKVLDFTPGEWIPPSFTTPPMLKQVLKEQGISPSVLQQICLTEIEQLTGVIDENSEEEILEVMLGFVARNSNRRDEAYIDHNSVPTQTAANCVEALVGTYFKSCGWQGALKVVGWLQLLPFSKVEGLLDHEEVQDSASTSSHSIELPLPLESLELSLNYSFNDKTLLVQALSHESFIHPLFQGTMNQLAFLGSSILDFLVTCYIFEYLTELNPSQMWRIREIVSSTSTLASLAVRHNIHKYLLFNSSSLLDAVDRFVKLRKGCKDPIDDEVQLLLEEHECETALQVEVPAVLARLLESLIGAVYLDSGKSLSLTWETFRAIFLPELDMWRHDIPLSVVDLLKDLSPAAHQVIFSSKKQEHGRVEVMCKILMDNTREEVFVACGYDELKTKTHAAKLALRNLLGITTYNY